MSGDPGDLTAVLRDLVRQEGPSLASDHKRLRALLADEAPGGRAQRILLVRAAEAGVGADLTSVSTGAGPADREQLVARLVSDWAMSDRDARWVVAAWAYALGVTEDRPPPGPADDDLGSFATATPGPATSVPAAGQTSWIARNRTLAIVIAVAAVPVVGGVVIAAIGGGDDPDQTASPGPSPAAVTCADGSQANDASACPAPTRTCSDGSVIAASGACPAATQTCDDGTVIAASDTCPPPTRTCDDGTVIAAAETCPTAPDGRDCTDGSSVASGDPCPIADGGEGFVTPSVNIACFVSDDGDGIRCDIVKHDWTVDQPPGCEEGDWGSYIVMSGSGEAGPGCVFDAIPNDLPQLDYGEHFAAGAFDCDVDETTGVTCTNLDGSGFTMSRRNLEFI